MSFRWRLLLLPRNQSVVASPPSRLVEPLTTRDQKTESEDEDEDEDEDDDVMGNKGEEAEEEEDEWNNMEEADNKGEDKDMHRGRRHSVEDDGRHNVALPTIVAVVDVVDAAAAISLLTGDSVCVRRCVRRARKIEEE